MAVTHCQAMSHLPATPGTVLRTGWVRAPPPTGLAPGREAGGKESLAGRGLAGRVDEQLGGSGAASAAGWVEREQRDAARSPGRPRGADDGLTGGPWGPGGPGVCEEQVQGEEKVGHVSPSFWKKGDPSTKWTPTCSCLTQSSESHRCQGSRMSGRQGTRGRDLTPGAQHPQAALHGPSPGPSQYRACPSPVRAQWGTLPTSSWRRARLSPWQSLWLCWVSP